MVRRPIALVAGALTLYSVTSCQLLVETIGNKPAVDAGAPDIVAQPDMTIDKTHIGAPFTFDEGTDEWKLWPAPVFNPSATLNHAAGVGERMSGALVLTIQDPSQIPRDTGIQVARTIEAGTWGDLRGKRICVSTKVIGANVALSNNSFVNPIGIVVRNATITQAQFLHHPASDTYQNWCMNVDVDAEKTQAGYDPSQTTVLGIIVEPLAEVLNNGAPLEILIDNVTIDAATGHSRAAFTKDSAISLHSGE